MGFELCNFNALPRRAGELMVVYFPITGYFTLKLAIDDNDLRNSKKGHMMGEFCCSAFLAHLDWGPIVRVLKPSVSFPPGKFP